MSNSLLRVFLSLGVGWVFLVAVGARYIVVVREATARKNSQTGGTSLTPPNIGSVLTTPIEALDPPGTGSETPSIVTPPLVGPGSPRTVAPLTPVTPSPPPAGVNWSAGKVLVLVALTTDAVGQHANLHDEITKIEKSNSQELVGRCVFMVGQERFGTHTPVLDDPTRKDVFPASVDGLDTMLKTIRARQVYVLEERKQAFTTVVIWHSCRCPVPPPSRVIGRLEDTHLVWTGLGFEQQLQFDFLDRIFGANRIELCGDREFSQISGVVNRLIPKP